MTSQELENEIKLSREKLRAETLRHVLSVALPRMDDAQMSARAEGLALAVIKAFELLEKPSTEEAVSGSFRDAPLSRCTHCLLAALCLPHQARAYRP